MSNLHPIFEQILNGTYRIPTENDTTRKPQDRPLRNEDYLEYHEDRAQLQIKHSDYGIRGWF